jgi:hypothetical protein
MPWRTNTTKCYRPAAVVDKDEAGQAIPAIAAYYDERPLPPENDA